MKKGYWVVEYRSISNEEALKEYGALAGAALDVHGGTRLIRALEVTPREAGLNMRTVVVEFESYQKALETYDSAEYKLALDALGTAAERDFRIVEGV